MKRRGMTRAEIKRALKGSEIRLYQMRKACFSDYLWHLAMTLKVARASGDTMTIRLHAQANERPRDDAPLFTRDDVRRVADLYGPACGGYYALDCEAEIRMVGWSCSQVEPETLLALRNLVGEVIESKNLRFVYPDCEASQVIRALEECGAVVVESKVAGREYADYQDRGDYLRATREATS